MKHFLTTEDHTRDELQALLDVADDIRRDPVRSDLSGRTIALLFLNPSLRTRTSFEIGAYHLGAHAVVLEPGKGAWGIDFEPGVVMDGDAEEHIAEVAGVLSRYCDALAIRAFPQFEDWSVDREDRVIRALAQHATVPVINMETIVHPCQELALMRAVQDRLGTPDGKKFGLHVTLLIPYDAYRLDERYLGAAEPQSTASGGDFRVTTDIDEAYSGAE